MLEVFYLILFLGIYSLLATIKREWGIYLIILLLPAYQIRFQLGGVPLTLLEVMILLLALIEGLALLKNNQLKVWFKHQVRTPVWQSVAIGAFLFAGALSVIISPEPVKAAGIFKAYILEPVIFYFLIIQIINTPKKLHGLWQSFSILVVGLGVFGIYQFLTLVGLPPSWWAVDIASRRIVSFTNHPNALALLVGPILAMLLIYQLKKTKIHKWKMFGFVLGAGSMALFLSFSRAGWLAWGAVLGFFGIFTRQRKTIFAFGLMVIILISIIPFTRDKLISLAEGRDLSQENRYILWGAGVDMIKQSPLLGVGLMGFREKYKNYPLGPDQVVQNYPHNIILNFWLEMGFLGLVAVGFLIFLFFKSITHLYKSRPGLALAAGAGMTVIILHGLVDVPYFKNDLSVLFWTILALPRLVFIPYNNFPSPKKTEHIIKSPPINGD